MYKGTELGSGLVPANSDVYFYTDARPGTGNKTARVFVDGKQQQTKAANPTACTETAPDTTIPGKVSGTFSWSNNNTQLSFQPSQPLSENTLHTLFIGVTPPFASTFTTGKLPPVTAGTLASFNATVNSSYSSLTFAPGITAQATLTSAPPVWDVSSRVFKADVTLANTSTTATYQGVRAVISGFAPTTAVVVNPSGYTSDKKPFLEFGTLAPGQSKTLPWKFYAPEGAGFTFSVALIQSDTTFALTSVSPATLTNDNPSSVTVQGQGIRAETSFFIQSNQLTATSWSATAATLTIPDGFPPANYGIMAVNPDGSRVVLYPGVTITEGNLPTPIDPATRLFSFVDGYVIDYATNQPLADAKVSIPGLETVTGPDGYFLLQGVPKGKHAVKIEKDGYELVYRNVEVTQDKQTVTADLAALEPKSSAVTNIGPEGGTHYANNGSFLVIPPGALDSTVPIQFTHTRAATTIPELPEDGYYLAFAHLGPSGLTFKKPATLFLPLQDNIVIPVGTPIRISYFDERNKSWVQDITSGVISDVNGKLFLEYEINHFTWIGGQWRSDNVTGCVQYADGSPAVGISTNFGVTDATGTFRGSTTRSDAGRTLTVTTYPSGSSSVSAFYDGRSDVTFGSCVVIPTPTPQQAVESPYLAVNSNDCGVSAGLVANSLFAEQETPASQGSGLFTPAAAPSGLSQFLPAQGNYTLRGAVTTINQVGFDPSSLQISVGGVDVTANSTITYDTVDNELYYSVTTGNLPVGAGLKFTASIKQRNGATTTKTSTIDVISNFVVPNVYLVKLPDDQIPSDVITPYNLESKDGKTIVTVVRDSDANNLFAASRVTSGDSNIVIPGGTDIVRVPVPIKAVDAQGNIMPLSTSDTFRLIGSGYTSTNATMTNGVATVTLEIVLVEGKVELDLGKVEVTRDHTLDSAIGSGSGSTECYRAYLVQSQNDIPFYYYDDAVWALLQQLRPYLEDLYENVPIAITLPLALVPYLLDGVDIGIYSPDCMAGDTEACVIFGMAAAGAFFEINGAGTAITVVNQFLKVSKRLAADGGGAFLRAVTDIILKYADPVLVPPEKLPDLVADLQKLMGDLINLGSSGNVANLEQLIENADLVASRFAASASLTAGEAVEFISKLTKRAQDLGLDPSKVLFNLEGGLKKLDDFNAGRIPSPLNQFNFKWDEATFLRSTDSVIASGVAKLDEVLYKAVSGGPTTYTHIVGADGLLKQGHTLIEMEKQFIPGLQKVVDGDIISKLNDTTVITSAKSLIPSADIARYTKDAQDMRDYLNSINGTTIKNYIENTTKTIVQFQIPRADMISADVYNAIKAVDPRIEIVDINGVPIPVPTVVF